MRYRVTFVMADDTTAGVSVEGSNVGEALAAAMSKVDSDAKAAGRTLAPITSGRWQVLKTSEGSVSYGKKKVYTEAAKEALSRARQAAAKKAAAKR